MKDKINFAAYNNIIKTSTIHLKGDYFPNREDLQLRKSYSVGDYIERILSVKCFHDLSLFLSKLKNDFGFTRFAFAIMAPSVNDKRKYHILYDVRDNWFNTYIDELLYDDPISAHAMNHTSPLVWSASGADDVIKDTSSKSWSMMHDFDINNVINLPCHNANGMSSGMRLSRVNSCELGAKDIDNVLPVLSLLNTYIFESASQIINQNSHHDHAVLTAREREILQWVAIGKTTWEISQILKISENTVLTHMKRIHQKLCVNSRQHAVAKAINLSIITI